MFCAWSIISTDWINIELCWLQNIQEVAFLDKGLVEFFFFLKIPPPHLSRWSELWCVNLDKLQQVVTKSEEIKTLDN